MTMHGEATQPIHTNAPDTRCDQLTAILTLLPHAKPPSRIDRIVAVDLHYIASEYTFRAPDDTCEQHTDNRCTVPASIVLETIIQTAVDAFGNYLASHARQIDRPFAPPAGPLIVTDAQAKFHADLRPGTRVITTARRHHSTEHTLHVQASLHLPNGETVATAKLTACPPPTGCHGQA